MDANISAAAASLRRAAGNMQRRIADLRAKESTVRIHEDQDEWGVNNDMQRTVTTLAAGSLKKEKKIELMKHTAELKERRRQLQVDAKDRIDDMEKEIHSLESQISRLNSIAQSLERWRG